MSYSVCAKCVTLDQRYYKASRKEFNPNSGLVEQCAAHVLRVDLRKQMIAHAKVCRDK